MVQGVKATPRPAPPTQTPEQIREEQLRIKEFIALGAWLFSRWKENKKDLGAEEISQVMLGISLGVKHAAD